MIDLEKQLNSTIRQMIHGQYAFYGLYLSELNRAFSKRISTAAVCKHPQFSGIQLLFNPDFWTKYLDNTSKRMRMILHECDHIINMHLCNDISLLMPDKKVANLAMDIFINQMHSEEFPVDDDGKTMGIFYSSFPELNLAPNQDTFYYYKKLMEAKNKKQDSSAKGEDSLAGEPGNGKGSSGSKNLDGILDQDEDIHSTWLELTEGLSDMEKEALKREIVEGLKRVADEIKDRGQIPANLLDSINNAIKPIKEVISWKTILSRFMASQPSVDVRTTRNKPNLRFSGQPVNKQKLKTKGFIGCDSSGSMSDSDMNEINSQMYHIWKAGAKIDYSSWDADCEESKPYDGKLQFKRTKSGGKIMCHPMQ